MDYSKFLNLVNQNKAFLNKMYENLDNEDVKKACEICGFTSPSKAQKIAILRRIVDLKNDPLLLELKKLNLSEEKINQIRDEMFKFTCKIHENLHQNLINQARNEYLLDDFHLALVNGVHQIGLVLNDIQLDWQHIVIDKNSKTFENMDDAVGYVSKHKLNQLTPRGEICDRSYGVVEFNAHNANFVPYAVKFKEKFAKLGEKFDEIIKNLSDLTMEFDDEKNAYIEYFKRLKFAFMCDNNDIMIERWRDAEMAWMEVRDDFQVGHPLEYYEDKFTHAVALEWDIRLTTKTSFDVEIFKDQIHETFENIYNQIHANNDIMRSMVKSNIDKTQLYISTPMVYYGAEMDGLFSAQVVPNDEFVSANSGKKIFAFVDFVYESAKAKPFMKLSSQIFDKAYLDFGREILFLQPHTWRKVYEITTIGHEFGHLFFIDDDTEARMNKSGVFKYIEEYKATTGGLMSFFLHENDKLKLPVLHNTISRAISLISWQEASEVRAYYCEGLIHLTLLFEAEILGFENGKLSVKFDLEAYESFKARAIQNYHALAKAYAQKIDAKEFLAKFCELVGNVYLPTHGEARKFVEFYYDLYKKIGNETDESNEHEIWYEKAKNL